MDKSGKEGIIKCTQLNNPSDLDKILSDNSTTCDFGETNNKCDISLKVNTEQTELPDGIEKLRFSAQQIANLVYTSGGGVTKKDIKDVLEIGRWTHNPSLQLLLGLDYIYIKDGTYFPTGRGNSELLEDAKELVLSSNEDLGYKDLASSLDIDEERAGYLIKFLSREFMRNKKSKQGKSKVVTAYSKEDDSFLSDTNIEHIREYLKGEESKYFKTDWEKPVRNRHFFDSLPRPKLDEKEMNADVIKTYLALQKISLKADEKGEALYWDSKIKKLRETGLRLML